MIDFREFDYRPRSQYLGSSCCHKLNQTKWVGATNTYVLALEAIFYFEFKQMDFEGAFHERMTSQKGAVAHGGHRH